MDRANWEWLAQEHTACGTIVLDRRGLIQYADGVAVPLLGGPSRAPKEYYLEQLELPTHIIDDLRYNSDLALATGRKRSFTFAIQMADGPHLWNIIATPSPVISDEQMALIISMFDGGPLDAAIAMDDKVLDVEDQDKCSMFPGSILAADRNTMRIVFVNSTALRSLKVQDDLLGKPLNDVLSSRNPDLLELFERVRDTGDPAVVTLAFASACMGPRYLRLMVTSSMGAGRSELVATSVDVTRLMSHQFGEIPGPLSKERYALRAVLDAIPLGLVILDKAGNVWLTNQAAEDLLTGMKEIALNPLPLENPMGHWQIRKDGDHPLSVALQEKGPIRSKEIRFVLPSGDDKALLVSAAPLIGDSDMIIGAVGTFRDITEDRRIEEKMQAQSKELQRSNEELQQFAYVASHDLQEPLRMVASYLQLLERRNAGKLDERSRIYLDYAVDGAERMRNMINDLLAYSRIESRGEEFEQVDMEAVLSIVIRDLKVCIADSGASITHDSLPDIVADKGQMILLLENLIGNAIKYRGEAAPQIHVSAECSGDDLTFHVRDNGIGIDPKHADHLFQMFRRLHTRDEYEGTGMGLAIARRIVERHGGRIWFGSEVGVGTTFSFTIRNNQ